MEKNTSPFANPVAIASYADDALRKVPGLADLHRMTTLLLCEQAPQSGHILVVGAGGGMELKAMAEIQREWRFTGVDPAAAMLDLARHKIEPFKERINLLEGTVEVVPSGPFDGATCLLTLHFLERSERLSTLKHIHQRLKPDARLVVAHHCAPTGGTERWLTCSAAFADRANMDWEKAKASAKGMQRLPLLSVEEEEAVLSEAGFSHVELFYGALSFRGWVATASPT